MEKMKFSVLMSVYKNDDPEHLREALKSIYDNQTAKPDEIVVVFDGLLTPELYAVLNSFRDNRENIVFFYPLKKNSGLGEALRIGSQKCTGDYIFRMDADDISHPQRFEKQIEYITGHPEIDVVGTDIAEFYNNTDETNMRIRICPPNHEDIVRMSKRRSPMNHVSVCIKKSALENSGGYKSLLLLEDYYLWIRMIAAGYVLGNINETLVYVRCDNSFCSKRGSKLRVQGWKTLQKYMVENGMISKADAAMNMMLIRAFTSCPGWVRKITYKTMLRK